MRLFWRLIFFSVVALGSAHTIILYLTTTDDLGFDLYKTLSFIILSLPSQLSDFFPSLFWIVFYQSPFIEKEFDKRLL